MGWAALRNGVSLRRAELLFDVFVTMDRGIPFQQAIHSLDVGALLIRAKSNNFQTLGNMLNKSVKQPAESDPVTYLNWIFARHLPRPMTLHQLE